MKTQLLLIKVTQEDIDQGSRKEAEACPIALACGRLPEFQSDEWEDGVMVLPNRIIRKSPFISYKLPTVAKAFVQAFDKGVKVEPFDFEIDLLQEKF